MNNMSKTGLQKLRELEPDLRRSTERLRNHIDLAKQQQLPARVPDESTPWGRSVSKLTRDKREPDDG